MGFLSIGFFGGYGHCLGMCHPFILFISGKFVGGQRGYWNLLRPHLMYNTGRVVTYSALGLIAGSVGNIADFAGNMAGVNKIAAIVSGVFLIAYGILAFVGYNLLNKIEQKYASGKIMNLMNKLQPKNPFTTGLVLGLLPCGLVYGVLIGAAGSGEAIHGLLAMLLFGIGTMAAMMTASVFGNFFMKRRGVFNMLSLALMTGMGAYFVYSGIVY